MVRCDVSPNACSLQVQRLENELEVGIEEHTRSEVLLMGLHQQSMAATLLRVLHDHRWRAQMLHFNE